MPPSDCCRKKWSCNSVECVVFLSPSELLSIKSKMRDSQMTCGAFRRWTNYSRKIHVVLVDISAWVWWIRQMCWPFISHSNRLFLIKLRAVIRLSINSHRMARIMSKFISVCLPPKPDDRSLNLSFYLWSMCLCVKWHNPMELKKKKPTDR